MKDLIPNITLPSIDPEQLIGYKLTVEHAGNLQKAEITEQVDDKTYHVEYVEYAVDGNDDHLTYKDIINMLNKEPEEGHH